MNSFNFLGPAYPNARCLTKLSSETQRKSFIERNLCRVQRISVIASFSTENTFLLKMAFFSVLKITNSVCN